MMKKLLLADDSITIQKVVGIIFSTEEYQLETTDDGDSAFQKALADHPDLVIADISMPGKDGFELCRAIKSEPSLAGTSVLLLPGAFDHFDEAKAAEVCADGWLTKPFESQALLDKVAQLLEAEPLGMAGVVAEEPESVDEPFAVVDEPTDDVSFGESSIDESALGLDAVDELSPGVAETAEESPDDIWDAVSFAEDELSQGDDSSSAETSAADVFGVETTVESVSASDFSEPVVEELEPVVEEPEAIVEEPEPIAADVSSFIPEDSAPEIADVAEESSFVFKEDDAVDVASETDDVDFSAFAEKEEDLSVSTDDFVDEASPFIAEVEEAEPLDLTQNFGGDEDEVGFSTDNSDVEDLTASEPLDESPALELEEDDVAEPEPLVATETFTEEPAETETLDLTGEDEIVDLEAEAAVDSGTFDDNLTEEEPLDLSATDVVAEEPLLSSVEGVVAPEVEEAIDIPAEDVECADVEDEILDLSVEEIVEVDEIEEEPAEELPLVVDDTIDDFDDEETVDSDEFVLEDEEVDAEPEVEAVESFEESAIEPAVEPDETFEEAEEQQEIAEVTPLEEDSEDSAIVESEAVVTDVPEEDEEFYFEEPEESVVEVAEAVTVVGAVATDTLADDETSEASATEQIEQQLRELSEDELKEVIAKVAGPMIEKLAGEMLEQVAWEVVPDLAEAMISEEIRKIKEGTE